MAEDQPPGVEALALQARFVPPAAIHRVSGDGKMCIRDRCKAAYDEYEFHVVSHAINDFCVVDLSSFYLDIIKDRLYCEEKDGLLRRSAQTALYLILDTITKLFAPILCFTCDEIWQAMPHKNEDDQRNVVLNVMNEPFMQYALPEEEMAKWDALETLRDGVNAALESARAQKLSLIHILPPLLAVQKPHHL